MKMTDGLYIFGPCSLESLDQITPVAAMIKRQGTVYMRAQLFKPRTRPTSFQGLGVEGLPILNTLRKTYNKDELKFVCEAGSVEQLEVVSSVASIIQFGARNMQNFELLKAVGKYFNSGHDFVLLKRGFANTLEEWVEAANYLLMSGVPKDKIVLCERGSRSLTSPTGVQLDFIAALEAKKLGFKVIFDPSHGTKASEHVVPMARAGLQLGLFGLMMECHPEPRKSVSDARQAISVNEAEEFILNSLVPQGRS